MTTGSWGTTAMAAFERNAYANNTTASGEHEAANSRAFTN
jgi:hypothetical protein